jgi:hypothetical protein
MNPVESQLQERARAPELALLRLQTRSGLQPLAFGLLCGLLLVGIEISPALLLKMPQAVFFDVLGGGLFFGASVAILAGFSRPVLNAAATDLIQLAPVLPLSEDAVLDASSALSRMDTRSQWLLLLLGVALGFGHSWLLGSHNAGFALAVTQYTSTILLWAGMYMIVPAMISNARLFSELGQIAKPDLLRPSRHSGFGAAALRPALFLIALLCAYSFLFIGDDNPLDGPVWIGVIASLIAMLAIVALPLRGIRRRIREQREQTLSELDKRLDVITDGKISQASAEDLFQLDAVLDMRERVARAPSWPFDVDAVKRILLYTVLPPLTWAAAAFVEMFIDSLV